jgi:hypothetical protein
MNTTFSEFETLPSAFTAWGYDELSTDVPRFTGLPLPKYDFRIDTRETNGFVPSTWVDQDESGDFDPNSKRNPPLLPHKRKRDRPLQTGDSFVSQVLKKPKTNTWQSGRYKGQNGLVTFRVGSEHARAVLQAVGTSSDNWPHGSQEQSETDSSDSNFLWSASGDTSNTGRTSILAQHLLRKRHEERVNNSTTGLFNFEDVTLGHPAARGCKACLDIRLPCTLLQEGSSYPCINCKEDDIECELILPPTRKGACESCKSRRIVCSYRAECANHILPCVQCSDSSLKCVAGPVTGRTRTGPSLDQDSFSRSKLVVKPPKSIASCTQCRQAKKWCSFRGRKDRDPPCKHCRENGTLCTKEQPLQERASNVPATPIAASQPTTTNPPITKVITTRLAHPVTFNYLPSSPSDCSIDIPCHWCTDPLYGILGLGDLRVEVLDPKDGTGYIELSGGHTAQGHLPSRICSACTLERLMIAACGAHEIEPLEGRADAGDAEGWMEFLMPGKAEEAPFEWCSVCPSPAGFGCCKRQQDGHDPDEEALGGVGCGLRLCESCAVVLVHECEGSLERLVRRVREGEGWGVRADVEFLLPEGELLRRVCCA